MQPPPRKVKQTQEVKLAFSEQVVCLQGKQQLGAELLEDIRSFSKQRAAVEKEYGQGLEQLQRVQAELVEAVRELNKTQKRYWQMGRITDVARGKAADAQARTKKSDHGIFPFRTGVQKMSAKLQARLTDCHCRLTEVRNENLLALAGVCAHQRHYDSVELPAIMREMDADLFDQLREQFTLLCSTEIDACHLTQSEFARIQKDASQVTREEELQIFLRETPTFSRSWEVHFQAVPGDEVSTLQHLSTSPGDDSCLDKEAQKWATKAAKDYKIIAHGGRALQTLDRRRSQLKEDEAEAGVERKMEEVKESVRKARVSRVKAEARLALLAEAGVDVEPVVRSTMSQAEEELQMERRLSEARKSSGEPAAEEDDFEFTDFEDFDENGDAFSDWGADTTPCSFPISCRVLYTYQASQADELSITEGEELQVIEDGDVEDWLKARNAAGQEGYVPERYLQWPAEGSVSSLLPKNLQLDSSFSSCESSPSLPWRQQEQSLHSGGMVRALYDYHGQSVEELSFQEGALIRLRRCRHGDVDDGFWEGELEGRVGVFPSLMVELLGEGAEEEDDGEDECSAVPTLPLFSPPAPGEYTERCSASAPGSWSADPEARLAAVYDLLTVNRGGVSSARSSPDLNARRIRPARAPPLPPVHRQSPGP
ncbi:F-BAR and double SH3 domains protein 1-like isoform X3 [Paramormyrops kingsleyae]|uniref:F-BAR and double SH3 domains protein 1-like isoform X3 n=1 Tax=Paramormyrops kingsleyae TaxID=1676925 RepID=UPI003B97AA49